MQALNRENAAREIEELVLRGISNDWDKDENATMVIVDADVRMPTLSEDFEVGVKAVAFDDSRRTATVNLKITGEFSRVTFQEVGSKIGYALRVALTKQHAKEK